MELELRERPKGPIIIGGFPGLGLVGTITTSFLIEHLNAKPIGKFWSRELPPVVAVHHSKLIDPLEIFYDKKNNIIILNALSNVSGLEWDVAEVLIKLCKELDAKEIINIEGVGSVEGKKEEPKAYYFTVEEKKKKLFEKAGLVPLKEGVAMGVTAALLLKSKKVPMSCIFVETHSALPDSRAAAEAIKMLDAHLGLKVDYKPLIKKAEELEGKLKNLFGKSKAAVEKKKQTDLNYLG